MMFKNVVVGSPKGILILGALGVVAFILGILAGRSLVGGSPEEEEDGKHAAVNEEYARNYKKLITDKYKAEEHLLEELVDNIDAKNIGENLRYLSEKPHLAGSERDEVLAKHIRDRFIEDGFDHVALVPYNVLLSRPNPDNPNKIYLTRNDRTIFESHHKEEPIHKDDEDPNFIHAFNAFTPEATVSTAAGVGFVYVNYGRIEDFQQLEALGINVSGHIVMARYGKIYRGNKLAHAEKFGAIGVILFSDPADVALEGTEPKDVYDNSFWLPGTGMQRGNTYTVKGDPLTPDWPSTEHAYRDELNESIFVKIPSQPIGYADAEQLLQKLGGQAAPLEWQGGLSLTYNLGPSLLQQYADVILTISTHNFLKVYKSYNVIGILMGEEEPDRYVIQGNHRDAWGYGAADPSSGTSSLLEIARVFGTLKSRGWRPRRTLVFCSWGAEEYGLIGSTEWVENHIDKLQSRTVAYLNTDSCATGPLLRLSASPLFLGLFDDITKKVPGVVDGSKSLFDEWLENNEITHPDAEEKPIRRTLGSGSDHAPFSFYAGIPAVDISFRRDLAKYNITTYPAYHTGYETFYLMEKYIDPGFKIMQGCGRVASLFLKLMSDSTIIPYTIERFPKKMLSELEKSKNRDLLRSIYDKYDELENSVKRFINATTYFAQKIKDVGPTLGPLEVRAINDQMMKLEQVFILPTGLPGRLTVRHAVFAPSQFDNYATAAFPGLSDLLFEYDKLTPSEKVERDKQVKRHVSDLMIMTDRAVSLLDSVDIIDSAM